MWKPCNIWQIKTIRNYYKKQPGEGTKQGSNKPRLTLWRKSPRELECGLLCWVSNICFIQSCVVPRIASACRPSSWVWAHQIKAWSNQPPSLKYKHNIPLSLSNTAGSQRGFPMSTYQFLVPSLFVGLASCLSCGRTLSWGLASVVWSIANDTWSFVSCQGCSGEAPCISDSWVFWWDSEDCTVQVGNGEHVTVKTGFFSFLD